MWLVSNEEFPPLPPTAAQRAVEDRILAEAGRLAPRLGWSRRDFLRRSGGMATSLLAMNAVMKMAYLDDGAVPSHRWYGWVAG